MKNKKLFIFILPIYLCANIFSAFMVYCQAESGEVTVELMHTSSHCHDHVDDHNDLKGCHDHFESSEYVDCDNLCEDKPFMLWGHQLFGQNSQKFVNALGDIYLPSKFNVSAHFFNYLNSDQKYCERIFTHSGPKYEPQFSPQAIAQNLKISFLI